MKRRKKMVLGINFKNNPLFWSFIEFVIFMVLAIGWFLLFYFSLEDRYPNLFPLSYNAIHTYAQMMLIIMYVDYYERFTYFVKMETLLDTVNENIGNTDGKANIYKKLLHRESKRGKGLHAFTCIVIGIYLFGLPWFLWGYYNWYSVIVYGLMAWPLLSFNRYILSYGGDLTKKNKHYFNTAKDE